MFNGENAKMKKSDLILSPLLPEKETSKIFVSGLKPDLFSEEINSRSCETLQEAMDESRS